MCLRLLVVFFLIHSAPASSVSSPDYVDITIGNNILNVSPMHVNGGRGIGIRAKNDFVITSVGLHFGLVPQSFDVTIYESADGVRAGAEIKTFSQKVGTSTLDWNDIDVDFEFEQGKFYVINWRPTAATNTAWAVDKVEFYDESQAINRDYGDFTLINGTEGRNAENPYNSYLPHMRFGVGGNCRVGLNFPVAALSSRPGEEVSLPLNIDWRCQEAWVIELRLSSSDPKRKLSPIMNAQINLPPGSDKMEFPEKFLFPNDALLGRHTVTGRILDSISGRTLAEGKLAIELK